MRQARGEVAKTGEEAARAVNQVKLLIEVARRVVEPADALPAGSRTAVLLALYRDAAYWMLAAMRSPGDSATPDLATAWTATAPETLLKAAGDADGLAVVRGALVEQSPTGALNATDEAAARARAFVESLLWEFEAPNRRVDRVRLQMWTRVAVVATICVLAALGVRRLAVGPNLVEGKSPRTSSTLPECLAHKCADLMFHTMVEDNPWADFDLAAIHKIHRVEVANRSDCCAERAVPLIIEVSLDDKHWIEVARRDAQFSNWTATFASKPARYVRLRVPRSTAFHLDQVAIH